MYAMDLRRSDEGQSSGQSISGSPGREAQAHTYLLERLLFNSIVYQLGQLSIWKQIKMLKQKRFITLPQPGKASLLRNIYKHLQGSQSFLPARYACPGQGTPTGRIHILAASGQRSGQREVRSQPACTPNPLWGGLCCFLTQESGCSHWRKTRAAPHSPRGLAGASPTMLASPVCSRWGPRTQGHRHAQHDTVTKMNKNNNKNSVTKKLLPIHFCYSDTSVQTNWTLNQCVFNKSMQQNELIIRINDRISVSFWQPDSEAHSCGTLAQATQKLSWNLASGVQL